MRRGDRLFELIQVLRRAKRPLTADAIAQQLETSKRTVYRDITALIGQRVPIRGEAGVGYVLDRGYDLPPLMLTPDEIEAVVLGSAWVTANADPALARAATNVLAKVSQMLPNGMRDIIDDPGVGIPPKRGKPLGEPVDVGRLRLWSRQGRKLALKYSDETGVVSERVVWPFMIGYGLDSQVLVAWCELRRDFRYFRIDRLAAVQYLEEHFPEPRAALRRRWLQYREDQELS